MRFGKVLSSTLVFHLIDELLNWRNQEMKQFLWPNQVAANFKMILGHQKK